MYVQVWFCQVANEMCARKQVMVLKHHLQPGCIDAATYAKDDGVKCFQPNEQQAGNRKGAANAAPFLLRLFYCSKSKSYCTMQLIEPTVQVCRRRTCV